MVLIPRVYKKKMNSNSIKNKGFTLAEALVTLIIIGVIAALTIPAILVNTEQNEYKSALKKALSMLNQVIEMNIALEGYGPIEATVPMTSISTGDEEDSLFQLFKNRMNVISTSSSYDWGNTTNWAFFTADGMRYEFPSNPGLVNNNSVTFAEGNARCATPGGNVMNDDGVVYSNPCLIIVDVNGQRRPNPRKTRGSYKIPGAGGSKAKILDVFPIIITDKAAYPYGVVAQRAMFQHD